jgi:hypothetical protein
MTTFLLYALSQAATSLALTLVAFVVSLTSFVTPHIEHEPVPSRISAPGTTTQGTKATSTTSTQKPLVEATASPAPKPTPISAPIPIPKPKPQPQGTTTAPGPGFSGPAVFMVRSVPLLFGGNAGEGSSVPVVYLQVQNIGGVSGELEGFTVEQVGSVSDEVVSILRSVDDTNVVRGTVGGEEGETPFEHGRAFVPAGSSFSSGEMRLFTIQAVLANNTSSYRGEKLEIQVIGMKSSKTKEGQFPVAGATWVIE